MRTFDHGIVPALACAGAVALSPRPSLADDPTLTQPTIVGGSHTLGAVGLTMLDLTTGVGATTDLVTQFNWTQLSTIGLSFDSNLVRQGRPLDPKVSYGRVGAGQMSLSWTFSNFSVFWDGVGPLDLGSPGFSAVGFCNLMADGGTYTCHLATGQVTLLNSFPAPTGPYVKLALVADVTITPAAIGVNRQAQFDGTADGTSHLSLLETPVTDTFLVPCTSAAGSELTFTFGTLSATEGITIVTSLQFDVGAEFAIPDPIIPFLFHEEDVSFAKPTAPIAMDSFSLPMSGAGASFDLGSVQKNNVPPVANAGGFYSGNEGSPVTFNGGGSSSICGFPTLVWNFSDGGVAFGRNPQHTFTDNAVYSGELTAIDATGMTALDTFSATIANLPPVVHAGPDTTSAWGIWLAFNGSATDPGAADQATLTYSWSFGDGSPSASGGASTTHAYAVPGDYFATLTSCDKDGACASATRVVHVLRRNTRAAYTGDSLGVFDTTATLAGSLFDEFGLPVAGRTVQLQAGSAGPFGAGTDVAGTARQQFTVPLAAGSYTASVAFAGDTLYNGTSANDLFTVVQKATSVMYTGSLFGKPNKATALSAILTDSSGKALAGRAVRFDVGTQSATGTTDAQGVAVTSLVLTQKNGLYTLTATYAPAAADAPYYVGSADSAAFALQMK